MSSGIVNGTYVMEKSEFGPVFCFFLKWKEGLSHTGIKQTKEKPKLSKATSDLWVLPFFDAQLETP